MNRTAARVAKGRPRCECGETSDLLREQTAAIAALREEVEALRSTCERALLELVRRIERNGSGIPQADTQTSTVQARRANPHQVVEEGAAPMAVLEGAVSENRSQESGTPMSGAEYSRLVTRIRSLVRTTLPVNAVVAVVSRGDEALVELEGRIAWHFPRLDDGRWVGHHPADDKEAVAHLELARRRGARYLLIPSTAFWWLDHYRGFADHLDDISSPVLQRDDACWIFALNPPGAA